MAVFEILQPVLAVLFVALLFSQCVLPELAGNPWFPMFRRIGKLNKEISVAQEEVVATKLEERLASVKQQGQKGK